MVSGFQICPRQKERGQERATRKAPIKRRSSQDAISYRVREFSLANSTPCVRDLKPNRGSTFRQRAGGKFKEFSRKQATQNPGSHSIEHEARTKGCIADPYRSTLSPCCGDSWRVSGVVRCHKLRQRRAQACKHQFQWLLLRTASAIASIVSCS